MTDVTPNEARMPEDAAVTVTNADTLRAIARGSLERCG